MKASKAQKVIEAVRADVARRSALPDAGGLRPSASSGGSADVAHTPTPWGWGSSSLHSTVEGRYNDVLGVRDGWQPSPADAAFIVRAVNHHDKLVSALRHLIAEAEASRSVVARVADGHPTPYVLASVRINDANDSPNGDAIAQARDILAEVEGR